VSKKNSVPQIIARLEGQQQVIGRQGEIEAILHCLLARRHVLLEGPVGVGKTYLVSAIAKELGRPVFRVDGDSRYTEHKLTGWFDPPTVLKKGYGADSFIDGPLVGAMRAGGLLFINELNRMPEGVQNVLLPALDEGRIEIPRLGSLEAKEGFSVVATQNPREFVATSHLSEALLDRFELISLSYQSEEEERTILSALRPLDKAPKEDLVGWTLALIRGTRKSPLFRRGASIRAGLSMVDIATAMGSDWASFEKAALLALPTRVELNEEGLELGAKKAIESLTDEIKKKGTQKNP
jgi:MoxR-like ATPase